MAIKQVSFLPWTKFNEIIKLGSITFWPYYKEADQRISDSEVKSHLDKYFRSYVDLQGNSVDTITICSYNKTNFCELNDNEWQKVRNAVDVLIFASIVPQIERAVCSDNRSWGPPSANVLELITQNFKPGDDHIAIQAGSLLSGGWKMGDITFPKPLAKGGQAANPDDELLKGFDKCFSPTFPTDVGERIFRSLEWFRLSHIEGSDISYFSKLVMMATAFEILLQFPREGKRRYFVDYMEDRIATDKHLKGNQIDHKGRSYTLSLAGCWAWDFYELRSQVVHGDPVPFTHLVYKDWITHLIVADLVFLECLELEFSIKTKTRWLSRFDDVHKSLGWVG